MSIETTEGTSVLRVREAVTNDSECYSVVVRCRCVTSQMSSSVTVEDCPDPPFGRPATTNETTDSIVLSWYGPVFDGASPVIGYKVEQKLSGKQHDWIVISDLCQHTTFHVKNLRAHTSYNFRISCVNKHGCSRPGIACEARTKENGGENGVEQNGVTQFDDGGKFAFEPRIVSIRRDKKFSELYISGELIGRGKFGVVQECFEIKTNRKLAAKVIKLKQGQKEEFREEVNIMNKLHHVKLLQLYDAFETSREAVLIMEFIEGRELMERIINEDYLLTERDCIYFLRQICSGIKYMHDLNVLHLDIKPENILCVRPDCNDIKIIDFGLSRMYDEKKPVKVMFGTAEFAAPEVINYDPVTPLTDMWSVGVVCYILLSGFSPFAGNSDAETFVNVTKVQYDFDEGFEDVSTKAQEFISCLLARNPKSRMTSSECLSHDWLVQYEDVTLEKTLDTTQHRKFLTRRKWQVG
uniref:Protein kinase domain-containing protein n=1 Tax=Helobdella robusta TaxID=6412 RepID=T1G0Q3_HELRO